MRTRASTVSLPACLDLLSLDQKQGERRFQELFADSDPGTERETYVTVVKIKKQHIHATSA